MPLVAADFSVAFLHTPMDGPDKVHVEMPWELRSDDGDDEVWELQRALYGLRRAAQLFQAYLTKLILGLGFEQSGAEAMMFVHRSLNLKVIIHVDDPLTSGSMENIRWFYGELNKHIPVRVNPPLGDKPQVFLGARYWRFRDIGVAMMASVPKTARVGLAMILLAAGCSAQEIEATASHQLALSSPVYEYYGACAVTVALILATVVATKAYALWRVAPRSVDAGTQASFSLELPPEVWFSQSGQKAHSRPDCPTLARRQLTAYQLCKVCRRTEKDEATGCPAPRGGVSRYSESCGLLHINPFIYDRSLVDQG